MQLIASCNLLQRKQTLVLLFVALADQKVLKGALFFLMGVFKVTAELTLTYLKHEVSVEVLLVSDRPLRGLSS